MTQARVRVALLCLSLGIFLILYANRSLAAGVREVVASNRSLTPIHTALGFSTILEFPGKPISAVLGDQDGFKLEYVGSSITLKPLVPNAKSNLFVFTDTGRYNFSLASGPAGAVDYIVSIRPSSEPTKPGEAKSVEPYLVIRPGKKSSVLGITLSVDRIKLARNTNDPRSASLIEFQAITKTKPYALKASSFGVRQGGKYLDIESIYLGSLALLPGVPVDGVIAVLNQDWNARAPFVLVLAVEGQPSKAKKQKTSRIEVVVNPSSSNPPKKGGVKHEGIELFPKPHP
jgi:hypothetical protein